jgi:hypothetical protein
MFEFGKNHCYIVKLLVPFMKVYVVTLFIETKAKNCII